MNALFSRNSRPAPLDPREAVARAQRGELTLVDVRDPSEIAATGKAAGAVVIPLSVFRMQADPRSPECHPALATDRAVAIYCASGARATMAAQMMRDMGYAQVHAIGGLTHWRMAGGQVTH